MARDVKTVHVTRAQKMAANVLVERSATTGRYVSRSVARIASASRGDASATA